MIQSVLVFALGALSASFLALLLLPLTNARAARLAERRLEALLPLSRVEMAARIDAVRAEMAARLARTDYERLRLADRLTIARQDRRDDDNRLADLEEERDRLAGVASDQRSQIDLLEDDLRASRETVADLLRRLDEAGAPETAGGDDAMKAALAEAEERIARLTGIIAEMTDEAANGGDIDDAPAAAAATPTLSLDAARIDELARRLRALRPTPQPPAPPPGQSPPAGKA